MRERLFTFACALGALALFLTLFMHSDEGTDPRRNVPRPTTEEQRGNGYAGALAWLDAEHIRAMSLRERFDKLPARPDLPASGNLLIITLPATAPFKTEEFRPLDRWVRAGNTLLVLGALSDSPDWAFPLGGLASSDLNLLTGLEAETARTHDTHGAPQPNRPATQSPAKEKAETGGAVARPRAIKPFAQPQRGTLIANRPQAYLTGVHQAVALSDYPTQAWTVKVPYDSFALSLAHQRETGEDVLWTRSLGNGTIIVSALGSLFTNRALGLADNGRLLANIVGLAVGPRGAVLFDDVHQGLGAAYDPEKFYRDHRLYATIGVLAALWLIWVLGSTRLRAPEFRTRAPRETELVRATGGFLARVLRPNAGARRMFEHFFRRINDRAPSRGDPNSVPWQLLERHPRIARADLEQLKSWYTDAQLSRRIPLTRLHNLILKIDRSLSA